MTTAVSTDWMAAAEALAEEMIARRRDLHRHPELAFEEVRTAGIVARELGALGLEVSMGVGRTGVVGVLEGASDGPTVLVRCDMDALPVAEANQTDYVSETPGKMHACGHDGHTSIALAVAKMLAARREDIAGRVKFIFQPAEEIAQGAMAMIDDGVLESPAPQVALGLHVWNEKPVGVVGLVDGPMMASANTFEIALHGRGGHGAMPDQTRDPLLAGAHIVTALQSIVSRNVSGLDTAALSVCSFNAGFTHNVIPAEARLTGTFRTYSQETNELIGARLREIATGVAASLGVEADVTLRQLTPPLINDVQTNRRLREAFGRLKLNGLKTPITWDGDVRTMASEDMACILARVPGTFLFVGSANAERGLNYAHHHPRFDFDERAMTLGAGLLAAAVAAYVVPA